MLKIALLENNFRDFINSRKELEKLLNSKYNTIALIPKGDKKLLEYDYFFYGKKLNSFSILKIVKKLFSYNPDLVVAFRLLPMLSGFIYCKIKRKRILCVITGLGRYFDLNDNPKNIIGSIILRFYTILSRNINTQFIVQNRNDLEFLTRLNQEVKVDLILGSGVPTSSLKWKKPDGEIKLVFISRCIKEKGILSCVQAINKFNQINQNSSTKVSLDIYGCDMKQFKKLFGSKNELNNIRVRGWTKNTIETLRNYHAIIFPSTYREGVPRVVLEAMSIGMPYLISRVPGNMEVRIQSKEYDLSFDTEDIVNHIVKMISKFYIMDQNKLSNLINQRFSELCLATEHICSSYLTIIDKIVAEGVLISDNTQNR